MKIQELSASERILLAEELWDSVASDEQLLTLTDDQKAVLEKRLENYLVDKDAGDSWENVRDRISGT